MWSSDHRELIDQYTPIINAFLGQEHPGVTVLNPHEPWDRSWRITDFYSQRQFDNMALCHEGYRPTESRFQLTIQVHCSPFSVTTATYGRNHRDFNDAERDTLDCLLPHFQQVAHRLVREQRTLEAYRHVRKAATNALPCMAFDAKYHLHSANAAAVNLLKSCPDYKGCRLPPTLIRAIAPALHANLPIDTHVMIGASCHHITGSASTNHVFRFVSLEEETPEKYFNQRHQKVLLTRREREIFSWVRQGKSNREIAIILGISPRTVGKHLEHIFEKTQVENRAALMIRVPE